MSAATQAARIAAVVVLVAAACAFAARRSGVPLALRGLARLLGRVDGGPPAGPVPLWRRLFAAALVAIALLMAVL